MRAYALQLIISQRYSFVCNCHLVAGFGNSSMSICFTQKVAGNTRSCIQHCNHIVAHSTIKWFLIGFCVSVLFHYQITTKA